MIHCPTVMAQYSLFVLKVPLNPKQTNKQNKHFVMIVCAYVYMCVYGWVWTLAG